MSGVTAAPTAQNVGKVGFRLPADILAVSLHNFQRDVAEFNRAVLAYSSRYEFHLRNLGEWWMIWTVLVEAHKDQMERLVLPTVARISSSSDDVKQKLKKIIEVVARITTNLLALRDAPAASQDPLVGRLRTLSASFVAEMNDYTSFVREKIITVWTDLPPTQRYAADISILNHYIEYGQWALPWLAASLSDEDYRAFVLLLPKCFPNLQFTLHRYWRPQWASRVAALLPSIYDSSVRSPTIKDPPHYLWCCFGYDKEDPLSKSCTSGYFTVIPSKPGAVKVQQPPAATQAPAPAVAPITVQPVPAPQVGAAPVIITPVNANANKSDAKAEIKVDNVKPAAEVKTANSTVATTAVPAQAAPVTATLESKTSS